jgi:hypothetical protein
MSKGSRVVSPGSSARVFMLVTYDTQGRGLTDTDATAKITSTE